MMQETETSLNQRNIQLLKLGLPFVLAFVVASTISYVISDIYFYENQGVFWLTAAFAWAANYLVFVKLMKVGGLLRLGQKTGVGTYFALALVMGLIVGAGLLTLIVPGLYLAMRWLPAFSRALSSEDGVAGSMRWSWDHTERYQKQLAIAMTGPILCCVPAMLAFVHYDMVYYPNWDYSWGYEFASSVIANLFISLATAWFTILGISAFGLVLDGTASQAPSNNPT